MYYIMNYDQQIIAADKAFLNLLEMENLQELFTKVAEKQISFIESNAEQIEIATDSKSITLTKTVYPLNSLIGELTLVRISESINKQEEESLDEDNIIKITPEQPNDRLELLLQEDKDFSQLEEEEDTISFLKPEEEIGVEVPEVAETENRETSETEPGILEKEDEDTISFLKPEIEDLSETVELAETVELDKIEFDKNEEVLPGEIEKAIETEPIIIQKEEEEEDMISFPEPEVEETIEEPDLAEAEKEEEVLPKERAELEPIIVDTEKISKLLGIAKEEYSEFLNEFIDHSIELEPELKEKNTEVQQKALSTLQKLSQILHLPVITDILENIRESSGEARESLIEEYYHALARLTTYNPAPETEKPSPEEATIKEVSEESICDLDFSGIKPIHFDFRLEEAAEDLSLPVDLIEEFVNDFIEQANTEKQTFIDACKSGDIETIQKTGHKLKGAASNLRINPLAETLEEVQFCEDRSHFEPLLKKYWGQFLAFELFMKSKSH